MPFIGLGNCKLYYTFIFVLVLFKFFVDFIEGFNENMCRVGCRQDKFFDFGSVFCCHPVFQNFVCFFSAVFCGIILYIVC